MVLQKIVKQVWNGKDEPYTKAEIKAHFGNQNIGKMGNREYANKYCENLTLGGYDDWRLPNIYELVTLMMIQNQKIHIE